MLKKRKKLIGAILIIISGCFFIFYRYRHLFTVSLYISRYWHYSFFDNGLNDILDNDNDNSQVIDISVKESVSLASNNISSLINGHDNRQGIKVNTNLKELQQHYYYRHKGWPSIKSNPSFRSYHHLHGSCDSHASSIINDEIIESIYSNVTIPITREHVEMLLNPFDGRPKYHNVAKITINSTGITVDRSVANWGFFMEEMKAEHYFTLLQNSMIRLNRMKYSNSIYLALNVHDCPPLWMPMANPSFPSKSKKESLELWKSLPLFSITKCHGYNHIPIIQWTFNRDGLFEEWDEKMKSFSRDCEIASWESRKQVAVFRGAFHHWSCWDEHGNSHLTHITDKNYLKIGRLWLEEEAKLAPELYDIHISDIKEHKEIWSKYHRKRDSIKATKEFVSMLTQAQKYRYFIVMEGQCGWADRTKHLLFTGSLLFIQETDCMEWYGLFLKPMHHYIPWDSRISGNLTAQIKWAKEHDMEAKNIAENGKKLAKSLFTQQAMQCWNDKIMEKYFKSYHDSL